MCENVQLLPFLQFPCGKNVHARVWLFCVVVVVVVSLVMSVCGVSDCHEPGVGVGGAVCR